VNPNVDGKLKCEKRVEAIKKFEGFGMLVEKKNTKVNKFGVEALQSIARVIRAICLYKISNINEKGLKIVLIVFKKLFMKQKKI
jgi:hypothetical protein